MSRACSTAGGPYAIGYTRVSTSEQANSGLGLEAQETAIQGAAARLGLTVARICTDAGVSGTAHLARRPGLADALNALRRGDVLLVAKRDRLARDAFLAVLIEREVAKKRGRIISAAGDGTDTDDPSAVFTRRILDAVAELERSLIAARTRTALQAKRARGERVGSVPRGYRLADDGSLEVDPTEQAALALLRSLPAQGYTMRATAAALNAKGYTTRRGGRWHHGYIALVEAR